MYAIKKKKRVVYPCLVMELRSPGEFESIDVFGTRALGSHVFKHMEGKGIFEKKKTSYINDVTDGVTGRFYHRG